MIQENEIVTLILAMGVFAFFAVRHVRIKEIPAWRTFLLAFVALTAGWALTVLEGFFWSNALNLLEHVCYALSSILLARWCWLAFAGGKEVVK